MKHIKYLKFNTAKLIVITFSMVICCLIATYAYLMHIGTDVVENNEKRLASIVAQVNESIYWRMDTEFKELETIADQLCTEDNTKLDDMRTFINTANKSGLSFDTYAIINTSGEGQRADGATRNFAEEDFFKYAIRGNRSLFCHEEEEGIIKNCNTYAIPVYQGNYVVAVLAVNKPIINSTGATDVDFLKQDSFLAVVDSNWNTISELNDSDENSKLNYFEQLDKEILTTKHGEAVLSEVTLSDGIDAYVVTVPIGIAECTTVAVVPKSVIVKSSKDSMASTAVLCGIIIVLITVGFVWLYITRKQYKMRLVSMIYRDQLTGYMNWTAFVNKYSEIQSKGIHSFYTLILCDIDGFKVINDVYGQSEGDRIIQLMAKTINEKLNSDEYFARVSADNFVILMRTKNDEEIISRIMDISSTLHNISSSYAVGTSFGVYKISGKHIDSIAMHDRAKLAKNTIKGNHQKTYAFYDEALRQKIIGEKKIENEMERALENHHFKLYLQPKYSFETEEIVGAEALVRWEHPDKGIISPGVFIPIFERNEFVRKLDFYIYECVCEMIERWEANQDKYKKIPISVNFSRVHLNYPSFCEDVKSVANTHNVDTGFIELELTESAAFSDTGQLNTVIDTLRQSGFIMTIDDFGSGYSSLNILKDLNIDVLKFDKEFLKNSTNNPKGQSILKNLIHMARELNLKTVAEGVETIEQVEFLKEAGCDIAQGFFYARPMPQELFEKLVMK